MTSVIQSSHLLEIALAGWLKRHQQPVIDYLIEENRVLKDQLEGQRFRFSDARRIRPGIGMGQVEAARGRLFHRVVVKDGYVRRYQILAPTEWKFHPGGVVARGLRGLIGASEPVSRRQAAMFISAVDPRIGYELQVH